METSSQDRNLPASQRKLQKARDDGQVSRSRDLSHLAVLGAGALGLMALFPLMFEHLKLKVSEHLSFNDASISHPDLMLSRLNDMASLGLMASALFALIVTAAAILGAIATGGWVASLKPLMPDFNRVNPLAGLGRLFTREKLADVLKTTVIMGVLIAVAVSFLSNGLVEVMSLSLQPSTSALRHLSEWLTHGMALLLIVVFLAALVDVPLQVFLHKFNLKMSHQEIKQEHKESEGNPHIKSRQRARQRDMANGNSIRAVAKADFVVMNPTHYAVAIKYDETAMRAPQVISKGADLLAMKIKELAKTHAIPVVQSPSLARALYTHAELEKDIPASLFTAVAQVLAYVYRVKAAMRGEGAMPVEPPSPLVPPELDPLTPATERAPSPPLQGLTR
jgi:flagellar biosynthesis protein FlhB